MAPCTSAVGGRPDGWALGQAQLDFDGREEATLSARRTAWPGLIEPRGALGLRKETLMAKLMKRVEEFAKSPKAKGLEKKMLRKAEDPKTRAKIAKRFKKLRKNA